MWMLDIIAKQNCRKILDNFIDKNFKDLKTDDVRYIARHINAYVRWEKRSYTRHKIISEIARFLYALNYLECNDHNKVYVILQSQILQSRYYNTAIDLHRVIREQFPDNIPTSIEEYREMKQIKEGVNDSNIVRKLKNNKNFPTFENAPYKNISWSKLYCGGKDIDIEKCRYVLKDYLTYISPKWGIRYSDHYGLVQFLFFKFKNDSEEFCRQIASEIVATLKNDGDNRDKKLLDRVKIFDSDEDIKPFISDKYSSKVSGFYKVDSKTLNAIDRLAEQQIVDSIPYQEQEIARINLMIREAMF